MAFCPACGEEAVDTFCESCLREQKPLVEEVKPFALTRCATCDRIKVRGHWTKLDDFDHLVERNIVFGKNALVEEVSFPRPVVERGVKEFTLPILVVGTVSANVAPYEEEYEVLVPVETEQCNRCSLATSSYFEGILQLRNPRDEAVQFIEKAVQRNPEVFITKAQDVRGGIDFQVTDQQWLHHFSHELHKEFGGEIKTQSKLITYDSQTSKQLFRLTALVRLPVFWRGDVLEFGKFLLHVQRMGSTLGGYELRRRKKTSAPCPADEEALILPVEEAVLSSVQPRPMILDPETYQEVPLAHDIDAEPGVTLRVVQDSRGKWYALEHNTDKGSGHSGS